MTHTVQDFLTHELNEVHQNIDRLKHGLAGQDPNDPRLAGQRTLLGLQESHRKFVEDLMKHVNSFDEAIELCREKIFENEHAHIQIASTENEHDALHSSDWWYTLHQIQFYTDFLNRIKTWRMAYA